MGFFDFLKRKELKEIENLKEQIKTLNDQILKLARYKDIIDVDAEIAAKYDTFVVEEQAITARINKLKEERLSLSKQYNLAHSTYERMQKEISLYQETLDIADYGMYAPHFSFDTSEKYKEEIIKVREAQKAMIKEETAAVGGSSITYNDSIAQGQQFVKGVKKIMLRAFNGECDSFVANVDWKNIKKMEERILKSWEFVNKSYSKQGIYITINYKNLKLKELRLAYEYQLKKHEEREEQKAIREQMREEEKARKEIEAAMIKAQKEEEQYQKALTKARQELEKAEGEKWEKIRLQVKELEARLLEANSNKERALSMAQQTKRGHVYVISNIGSFGENVYKIGMTRRLDPMDRVKELGDASVPFPFDIHAIIFSEDAPGLEHMLHKEFSSKRLNMVNPRKEFFNVTLEEVERVVLRNNAKIEFTRVAEARDYNESMAIKNRISAGENLVIESKFPKNIFEDE